MHFIDFSLDKFKQNISCRQFTNRLFVIDNKKKSCFLMKISEKQISFSLFFFFNLCTRNCEETFFLHKTLSSSSDLKGEVRKAAFEKLKESKKFCTVPFSSTWFSRIFFVTFFNFNMLSNDNRTMKCLAAIEFGSNNVKTLVSPFERQKCRKVLCL